jgi:hypothetical protein
MSNDTDPIYAEQRHPELSNRIPEELEFEALDQQEFLHGLLTVQNNTQSQEILGD